MNKILAKILIFIDNVIVKTLGKKYVPWWVKKYLIIYRCDLVDCCCNMKNK